MYLPSATACRAQPGRSSQALAVFVQQPYLGKDPRGICTLVQTCKGWRAAAKHADAHLSVQLLNPSMQTVAKFVDWLDEHGTWVSELDVYSYSDDPDLRAGCSGAISTALKLAAVKAVPAGTAGQLQGLHLSGFSCNILSSPAVLGYLPADSLTRLEVTIPTDAGHIASKVPSALTRLTNLKDLQFLHAASAGSCKPAPLAPSWIKSLTGLTHLALDWLHPGTDTALLPPQVQRLYLAWSDSKVPGATHDVKDFPTIDLRHLSCLTVSDCGS